MQHKQKLCRACKTPFIPVRPFQRVCGPVCAFSDARTQRTKKAEKALRASDKRRKRALRTKSDWIKLVQIQFNTFIRLRDARLPCVSCGTTNPKHTGMGGAWDCGHFLSTGAHPEHRFEELNAAKQCKKCNNFRAGNIQNYRKELINRIGHGQVAWLEGEHKPKQYTIDELEALERHYKKKIKELKCQDLA